MKKRQTFKPSLHLDHSLVEAPSNYFFFKEATFMAAATAGAPTIGGSTDLTQRVGDLANA